MKRIFIIAPCVDYDNVYHVCEANSRDPFSQIYDEDRYKVIGSRLKLDMAIKLAKRHGAKRPTVI